MAGDAEQIGQDDIEKLLAQAKSAAPAPQPVKPAAAATSSDPIATLGQNEIEALLKQGGSSQSMSQSVPTSQPSPAAPPRPMQSAPARQPAHAAADSSRLDHSGIAAGDIEYLFNQAEKALASIQGTEPMPPGVSTFKLVDFSGAPASTESATLDLLRDVELDLKIELGRTHMYLEDVLKLSKGAVVPLDRLAGDPVDIYVNGRLIARGEVLILNDNFCVRVAELVAGESAVA